MAKHLRCKVAFTRFIARNTIRLIDILIINIMTTLVPPAIAPILTGWYRQSSSVLVSPRWVGEQRRRLPVSRIDNRRGFGKLPMALFVIIAAESRIRKTRNIILTIIHRAIHHSRPASISVSINALIKKTVSRAKSKTAESVQG